MTVEMRIHRPADYYSTASPERVLPQWASYGCGAASLLILVLVFAGGSFLAHGGFTDLMDFVFGMTMGEMRGMYTADVTAAQKQLLDQDIETMRKNLREEKITIASLQPVLRSIQKATNDKKVDGREADAIVAAVKKVNAGAKKK